VKHKGFEDRNQFEVHVTVNRVKFLIIKPTRCNNFSNLFLEWNSAYFGQFFCLSAGVFHCTHSNGLCHAGMSYSLRVGSGWNCGSILILLTSCII